MQEKNVIVIDDGLKTYTIENKNGKVLGEFSFNPSDTNIVKRYEEVKAYYEGLKKKYEDGLAITEGSELVLELEKEFSEKMNYLFNSDVSQDFFGIMGAFSVLPSGKLFAETVIETIGQAIKKELKCRLKNTNAKIRKATEKYHK